MVLRLQRYLRRNALDVLDDFLVHGSVADHSTTAYSDLDTLALLRSQAVREPSRIRKAQQILIHARQIQLEFDPLQHHGHHVLNESDFPHYSDAYLPTRVLGSARSLLKEKPYTLLLQRQNSTTSQEIQYSHLLTNIKKRLPQESRPRNLYQAKHFLSQLMLLPALHYQAEGISITKREAIERMKREGGDQAAEILETLTIIRKEWEQPMHGFISRGIGWMRNPSLFSTLQARFSPKMPPGLCSKLSDAFFQSVSAWVEKLTVPRTPDQPITGNELHHQE